MLASTVRLARCATLKERYPPRQKSKVKRLKAQVVLSKSAELLRAKTSYRWTCLVVEISFLDILSFDVLRSKSKQSKSFCRRNLFGRPMRGIPDGTLIWGHFWYLKT